MSAPDQATKTEKRSAWLITSMACGGMLLSTVIFLVWLFSPILRKGQLNSRRMGCLSNNRLMLINLKLYSEDWEGTLPAANAWIDRSAPYTPRTDIYTCPEVRQLRKGDFYGYAFNAALDKVQIAAQEKPETTVMTYDSTTLYRNATDKVTSLPSPGRHAKENLIGFLDGHAKYRAQP